MDLLYHERVKKMNEDLTTRIENRYAKMSKGQKKIADFIENDYDKAAYLTAAKLGELVGVSESTIVRFAMELEYEGYSEFQRALQENIRNKLTAVQRMKMSENLIGEQDILTAILQSDIDKIRHTMEMADPVVFDKSVNAILNAEKIYILGVRSASAIAGFLGFYFNLIFDNVRLVHTTSVSEMFEQILRVNRNDVVIGISFPRYSKRTISALQYAKNRGAKVVSLTDTKSSPLVEVSDYALLAKSDMSSFVDSLVAPMSMVNALIMAVSLKKKDEVHRTFEYLEEIWDQYNVYEKADKEYGD